jgi:lipopolysaccharide/colanic/teichoic acid biosynthesis glycosyltransferase
VAIEDVRRGRLAGRGQARAAPMATPASLAPAHVGAAGAAKRLLDLGATVALLALFALPMLAIGLAVRLTSPGPILFRQLRVGRGGRFFTSYKFRSMYIDAEERMVEVAHLNEAEGPIFKIRQDPRTTPFGRFLRRSSLDELPQLFNVLRGDMSLVGPRPGLMSEVLNYEPWQLERLTVKPGLTGLWQVSGRSELSFDDMVRLDLEYIRRRSFPLDVWLLLRTIPAVLSARGAY